ncbi:MAG: hypothetical protein FJZ61_06065 [Chlamydiae bacterium]|nr:hypothetical protein [Chlamydiota bacterium]
MERTVKSYERLVNKKFQILDAISGRTDWCDFVGKDEWGECTNVIQNDQEAKHLFQNLFNIKDFQEFEKMYGVKVTPNSIPSSQGGDWREYRVDTKSRLQAGIEKKLTMTYPYQMNSFLKKGTLIVEILDPSFCGFEKDIEISSSYLDKLAVDIDPLFQESCFSSILLVDALNPFDQDVENSTYKLKENF